MLYVLMMIIGAGIAVLSIIYGHGMATRVWKAVLVDERAAKAKLEDELERLKAKL